MFRRAIPLVSVGRDTDLSNYLGWVANGSSTNPIVERTIETNDFGSDPFTIRSVRFGPGALNQEMGTCTSVAVDGSVAIMLTHAGGRESAARSFTP